MVIHQSDTKITCPECREELTLSPFLASLNTYQCSACSFMIDLRITPLLQELGETRRSIGMEIMNDALADEPVDFYQQVRRASQREYERLQVAQAALVALPSDTFVHRQALMDVRVHQYARDLLHDIELGLVG